jgi:hydrogenase maturation protease
MKIVVIGLGNDIRSDDGVGIWGARKLMSRLGDRAHVYESETGGIALLDFLVDADRAIILDSVLTEGGTPGEVFELPVCDLPVPKALCVHYCGIPEALGLGEKLGYKMPGEVKIFAVEVKDPFTIRESMTEEVEAAIPELVARVEEAVNHWLEDCHED